MVDQSVMIPISEAKGAVDRIIRDLKAYYTLQSVLDAALTADAAAQAALKEKTQLETEIVNVKSSLEAAKENHATQVALMEQSRKERDEQLADATQRKIDKMLQIAKDELAELAKKKSEQLSVMEELTLRIESASARATVAEQAAIDLENRLAKSKAELLRMAGLQAQG